MLRPVKFLALVFAILAFTTHSFSKEPGDKTDDFTLSTYDGKKFTLSEELKNSKAVVVMFWSTQCPFAQAYNNRAKELYNAYHDKGIAIWAINSNSTESNEEVASHAKENGFTFPVLKDKNNVIADMLGAERTPEVYVIDKDKVILYHGRIDDNKDASKVSSHDLKNALDEILAGKDVSVKSTKSFGCTIKKIGNDN